LALNKIFSYMRCYKSEFVCHGSNALVASFLVFFAALSCSRRN
jgi:hypothetical protein